MIIEPIVFLASIFAYSMSVVIGKYIIAKLEKLKLGQNIREDGPSEHLRKSGTPTMGGIIFLITIVLCTILFNLGKLSLETIYILVAFVMFAFIGFLDDYIKIVKKRNLGLDSKQKIILQFIFSLILATSLYLTPSIDKGILVPFLNNEINIGILYIPLIMFIFIGATNAVNLTDGLDGLCTSVTVVVIGFFLIFGSLINISQDMILFFVISIGALLGFLRYNSYKAQVFMGDTGSLALGGLITMTAVVFKLELFLVIVGGVYVLEAVSVMIQVLYYKKTKKRFFKMAPIHHHFEKEGLSETKIVTMFTIATLFLSMLALVILKGYS